MLRTAVRPARLDAKSDGIASAAGNGAAANDGSEPVAKEVVVLDVRNAYEWDAGHFEGAARPLEASMASRSWCWQFASVPFKISCKACFQQHAEGYLAWMPCTVLQSASGHEVLCVALCSWYKPAVMQRHHIPIPVCLHIIGKVEAFTCNAILPAGALQPDTNGRKWRSRAAAVPSKCQSRHASHDVLHRRHPLRHLFDVPSQKGAVWLALIFSC
jgi:hypothetical protein